jgi:hypothetical protein
MPFKPAEKKKSKLRLGIAGTSGSGKTYSALLIAQGLQADAIAFIDTENGSGDLYSDLCSYQIDAIQAPFTPQKYIDKIKEAEDFFDARNKNVVIIIDSLTHAWKGAGGVLDIQSAIAKAGKGNSYTAWRDVTPQHEALVNAILQSPAHIIATIRSKQAYAMANGENGKIEIQKLGLEPVQREGMEYEFTIFFDMAITHYTTASKDRTRLFSTEAPFIPTIETGEKIMSWLNSGADVETPTILTFEDLTKQVAEHKSVADARTWWKDNKESIEKLTPDEKTALNKAITEHNATLGDT